MGRNTQEINISQLKSEERIIRFLSKQSKIGILAGSIGLLSFLIGIASFIFLPELNYFGVILFIVGLLKSIIYFSNHFVMKTKLSINTDLFNLDKNSYLIEQSMNSKHTYDFYQKLMFGYGFGILFITSILVYTPVSANFQNALLGVLLHAFIAFGIFYCEYANAKTVIAPVF